MKFEIFTTLILSIILNSCNSNDIITTPEKYELGTVSIQLDKQNAPKEVSMVTVELQRDNFQTITESLSFEQSSFTSTILFKNIAVGTWKIVVEAINSEGITIYEGNTNIVVQAGITLPVFLQLSPTTGNILLVISWVSNNMVTDYENNPILKKINNSYDYNGIAQSFILKVNNKYNMWYNGIGEKTYIFHAESNDGINWNRVSNSPVMSPSSNGDWDSRNIYPGPIIYENGIYKMFYTGRKSNESDYEPWHIGLSVSQDGINWIKNSSPIIYGEYGTWDLKMGASSVIKFKNKYYLYYTGKEDIYDHKIGVAYSYDGLSWTKYENNPVLVPSEEWEGSGIYWPSVIEYNGHLIMIYQNNLDGALSGFGIAYSSNGLDWVKFNKNPILKPEDTKLNNRILYPNLHYINNEFWVYYTNYPSNLADRSICVAKFKF